MLEVNNVSMQFGSRVLFKDVNLKFQKGNCYGVIGANGAGKSTFMKILSNALEPTSGEVILTEKERISILKQDQNAYDHLTVIETVRSGYPKLIQIEQEKEKLYSKEDFTEEDGIKTAELENEYMEMNGYESESEARSLLSSLGIKEDKQDLLMSELDSKEKVKVLLAQALFGNPDILLLDEPTNHLDSVASAWLENFLYNFDNIVIVVSHDRYFLNKVCTRILDVDYGKISLYVGNYSFWYESSQLIQKQMKDNNLKKEQRIKELQDFIARFAANASKSKQATSRKKELEKIQLDDIKPSNRVYPFIDFRMEREIGNDTLEIHDLTIDEYIKDFSFYMDKKDKIAVISDNTNAITAFFDTLMGKREPTSGTYKFGITVSKSYMENDIEEYFKEDITLIDWLRPYSDDDHEAYIRGFLGRMLFSNEEALKHATVLSGGEKVRCILAKMMLSKANLIILDDPTNHLDLESISALNKSMINFKGAMLFSSHDHELLQSVANRILYIKDGKVIDKRCTYDEFLETYLLK